MLAGWLVFIGLTAALQRLAHARPARPAAGAVGAHGGLLFLPRPPLTSRFVARSPELGPAPAGRLRAGAGAGLTAVGRIAGPAAERAAGTVPDCRDGAGRFTHVQRGTGEMVRLLRGMVIGFAAFALFFFTLAVTLRHVPTAAAFAMATAWRWSTQGVALALVSAARRPSRCRGWWASRRTGARSSARASISRRQGR